MQDGSAGAGARNEAAARAREANLILSCRRTFIIGPPVGGLFSFKFSSGRHPRKFGQKRFLAVRRSWRGNGVACFWATSLKKIFGGVFAIISFRPGGWMQQSAVSRCAILSDGSTGSTGSEAARVHRAARRRGHNPRGHREEVMTSK